MCKGKAFFLRWLTELIFDIEKAWFTRQELERTLMFYDTMLETYKNADNKTLPFIGEFYY
ncbi:hypothetical protein GCM10009865_39450 [Aeromicrobium ponti]